MNRTQKKGARLTLPRDLQVAYSIGRMGVVTAADLQALFWGSGARARAGLLRLQQLDLVRTFPRLAPSLPAWYALSATGREWVLAEVGAAEQEIRLVTGIGRINLAAVGMRNRLWVSLIVASREPSPVKLLRFRPERELRAESAGIPVVPDALVTLEASERGPEGERLASFMVEFDSGSERTAVLLKKAIDYSRLRTRGSLYGATNWQLVTLVPSLRRARSVASAVVDGGAGAFTLLGLSSALDGGHAFDAVLWTALELAHSELVPSARSLADGLMTPSSPPEQRLLGVQRSNVA